VSTSTSNDGGGQGPWTYEIHAPEGSGIDLSATPGVDANDAEREVVSLAALLRGISRVLNNTMNGMSQLENQSSIRTSGPTSV
jgi:hypothetical protein